MLPIADIAVSDCRSTYIQSYEQKHYRLEVLGSVTSSLTSGFLPWEVQPRKFETALNCHLYLTFVNICKTWSKRQELDGIPRNNILSCGIQPGSLGPRPEQARALSVGCRWRWPPDVLFNTCRSFSKLPKNFPSYKWSKHPTQQNPMKIVRSSWIFFLIFYPCIQIQNLWYVPCKLWSHLNSIPFHAHDKIFDFDQMEGQIKQVWTTRGICWDGAVPIHDLYLKQQAWLQGDSADVIHGWWCLVPNQGPRYRHCVLWGWLRELNTYESSPCMVSSCY